MLLLFFNPQLDGFEGNGYDLSLTATTLLSRLGAVSWTDLDWATETEVFSYFDEAAKRLATESGAFLERDATQALGIDVAQYTTPFAWISTVHVSASGLRLRPTSVAELLALDDTWETTPGAPTRYSMDAGPLGTITLYPLPQQPQAGQPLSQIYHLFPPALALGQTLAPLSATIADYFLYFALMRLRSRQSESAMPEIAEHAKQRCQMYESIFAAYWGEA